ncbi:GMC family oxidoreductase [Pseudomonas solani]|uniref:GMC family oxidoreductase n=1 Tax=Pseudomonas solani TaxID=2731552 RepID=UPI003C2F1931
MKKHNDSPSLDAIREGAAGFGASGRRDFLTRLLALGAGAGAAGMGLLPAAALAGERDGRPAQRLDYDYVIVGAGSSGCLLADRLSATGASVLLIEAGSHRIDQPKVREVALWLQNIGSDTDWARQSTAQAQLDNRQQALAAGKVVGGSGSINAMIWLRGDPRDLAQWQRHVGGPWTAEALLRAYDDMARPVGSPGSGPSRIRVGRYADPHPLTAAYLAASGDTGLRTIELNAGRPLNGAGVTEVNATADGYRVGPAQAFLVPALARANLSVLADALITNLIIQGNRCRGVRALVDNALVQIRANRETILCAGTCESPKLLMLSGIGPLDELRAQGIPVRQHLPAVGRNLQDHLLLSLQYRSRVFVPPQLSNGVSTMSYYSNGPAHLAPDVQVAGMQYPFGPLQAPAGGSYTLIPFLAKPRSRGRARLAGTDPRQSMLLDPGYLAERVDRDNMVFALERGLALGASRALAGFNGGLYPADPLRTYAEKLAFIARNAGPGLHYTGTCSAGRDPASSVVDSRFRVWGVDGLRVVDASVIPEMPAVNIHASVLSVAQLAAKVLVEERRSHHHHATA